MTPLPEVAVPVEGGNKVRALIAALAQLLAFSAVTAAVVDSDNAATTGTALNVVDDGDGFAHLESALAGAADTTFELVDGGPTVPVTYAATPGGVQLYFDEDATDSFLRANLPSGADVYIRASDGRLIRVLHDATPSTEGVAVYIDDDASNDYEKLLFVSPTDADGAFTTDVENAALELDADAWEDPTLDVRFDQKADGSVQLVLTS